MGRGNAKNRGRGGFRGSNIRGRGWGAPRGRGNSRGKGRGRPSYMDDFDLPIQQWPSDQPPSIGDYRDFGAFRARGRGRGVHSLPGTGTNTPRQFATSNGRGRGQGESTGTMQRTYGHGRGLASKLKAGAPLSKILYEDRPFLRPVIFVRSIYNPTLFQEEEDIFQPIVEAAMDGDEKSHVPTADVVSRVFNPATEGLTQLSGEEEELEEVDFAEIGRIQAEVDAAAAIAGAATVTQVNVSHESTFFVDTTPAPVTQNTGPRQIAINRLEGALGEVADDEDVIVYIAPHPRTNRASPPGRDAHTLVSGLPPTSIISGLASVSIDASTSQSVPAPPSPSVATSRQLPCDDERPQPSVTLELGTLYPEESAPRQEFEELGLAPDPGQLPPPPSFESMAFSFEKAAARKQARRLHPVGTPRSLLKRSRKARRKPLRGFGAYGAMHEEALLHDVDPRRDEQRRGDSDINWGDSDEDDAVEELSAGVGDMEIDENISLSAMKSFVHSMSTEGSKHVTMDDIADVERMREEDEEEQARGTESLEEEQENGDDAGENLAVGHVEQSESESESESEDAEIEAIMHAEEAGLIGESEGGGAESGAAGKLQHSGVDAAMQRADAEDDEGEDDEDDEEDEEGEESSEDEETPQRGFQTRLERLRSSAGKGKGRAISSYSDDSSDEAMSVQMTWADEDEDFFDSIEVRPSLLASLCRAHVVQEILDANQHILLSRDRSRKKQLFTAIRDGDFERDIYADMMAPAKRGKDKDVPLELREQWEKDRQKKAENKRKRALERMQIAADPLAKHKGGKKGHKAMLSAARAAQDVDLPNRITDFVSLEQQIRRFLADIGGPRTMALPPADKETRKRIHELAGAFNLKSQSKGSGDGRYTTLVKTSKSGIGINEKKIRRILKQATYGAWEGPDTGKGKGRAKVTSLASHREGEEVGKEAPKIGQSNIGFKMLAAMGWSDGDRIGLSGGLDAPLTAIMKKTKRGLGAAM
ncbi:hypothetical protein BD414DRAFT_437389 [Trametes punicea]|nr:hypothetical protein BD414DRAFT_437389 [Trametes punicea]